MVIYNPTDSRFLTLAQTRTNNGTKDVKLILDRIDKVFYTLDDDGNFDAVDNETAATIAELSVGTLKGDDGNPIILENQFQSADGGNSTFTLADDMIRLENLTDDIETMISNSPSEISMSWHNYDNDIKYDVFLNGDGWTFNTINGIGDKSCLLKMNDRAETLIENKNTDILIKSKAEITPSFVAISQSDIEESVYANMNLSLGGEGAQLLFQGTDYFSTMTAGDGFASLRFADENVDYRVEATAGGISITGLPSFDDDAAASGLTQGNLYITTGDGAAPLNVAGIVMMKL
jgi:hypothetical protein